MYRVTHATFRTPRGREVTLNYREDTNDFNTLRSCLDEDEYGLKELNLSGTVLDIGAYIGGVTIAMAADNPDLRVVAVEALTPNVVLLRENVERNGLDDQVVIIHKAAGKAGPTAIKWDFTGSEAGEAHRFVGNASWPDTTSKVEQVEGVTLSALTAEYGPFTFLKIDCEGCEHDVLADPAALQIPLIRGEEHTADQVRPLEIVR